jgi:hypothetical protein
MSIIRNVARRAFNASALAGTAAILLGLLGSPSLQGQEAPNWSSFVSNSSITMGYTGSLVPYETGSGLAALVLVYTDTSSFVDMAYTNNGTTYTELFRPTIGGSYLQLDCNQGQIDVCSPAAAVYGSVLYIAYPNTSDGLSVITAVPTGSPTNTYTFTSVYTDNSVHLTSSPTMIVSPNGDLLIKYGTSNNPSLKNASYVTEYNGSTWSTYSNGGNSPTRSAMVVFNGVIYSFDKQNNSSNGTWISTLDNNGIVQSGHQVSGMYTGLGYSATVFNNNIVVAFQQNASTHYLWVFSSPDASTFYSHEYGAKIGATPIIANYDSGLALAFKANDSTNWLWAAFATD